VPELGPVRHLHLPAWPQFPCRSRRRSVTSAPAETSNGGLIVGSGGSRVSASIASGSIGSGEEPDLVARIAIGDGSALHHLYARYGSLVHSIAARVTQDRCAAEDVAQQVFIRVWERPTAFAPDRGSLRTWLSTLAHGRAVDHVRREQAGRRREQQQLPGPPSDVEELATTLAMATRVRRAVDALPDDQRTAIVLAYYEAKTYRQVAATLDIPEGTAKSRLRLGLRRIGKRLEEEGLGAPGPASPSVSRASGDSQTASSHGTIERGDLGLRASRRSLTHAASTTAEPQDRLCPPWKTRHPPVPR